MERSAACSSASIRGVSIAMIPLPIQFETAWTKFTAVGEEAANELLAAIKEQVGDRMQRSITIIGHTDERGADDYNMRSPLRAPRRLRNSCAITASRRRSLRSAAASANRSNCPTRPSSRARKFWALNRRVEWKRD